MKLFGRQKSCYIWHKVKGKETYLKNSLLQCLRVYIWVSEVPANPETLEQNYQSVSFGLRKSENWIWLPLFTSTAELIKIIPPQSEHVHPRLENHLPKVHLIVLRRSKLSIVTLLLLSIVLSFLFLFTTLYSSPCPG